MADQGKAVITLSLAVATARGTFVSGAGTKSATLRAVGVADDETTSANELAPVQISGTALGLLGASLSAGAVCMSNASGALIAVTSGNEQLACAVLLEGGSSGELRNCKLL